MRAETVLHIQLTPVTPRPKAGMMSLHEVHGGPGELLRWLETQLGLAGPEPSWAERVTELAKELDVTVGDSFVKDSFVTDRWATASELLVRRDELRLAGWQGTTDGLPPVAQVLVNAGAAEPKRFRDLPARLLGILHALDQGQALPAHRVVLRDAVALWPMVWRRVLERVCVEDAAVVEPAGQQGSSLRVAQQIVGHGDQQRFAQDESFRFVTSRSATAACEFIASALAKDVGALAETVVYCEDDALAIRLDACLSRNGLPTMGAECISRAHPALQVLPLTLSLCWTPVDPQQLLDFLTLPISPINRHVARPLIDSLVEQPGLGSKFWNEAVSELTAERDDQDKEAKELAKKSAKLIDTWLRGGSVLRSESISTTLVRERCGLVAQWAQGRAAMIAGNSTVRDEDRHLVEALQVAAGQAAALGELAEVQGRSLTEAQLARLLEEVMSAGVVVAPYPQQAGGPTRVRSLAEIDASFRCMIWLGVAAAGVRSSSWTQAELGQIAEAGLDLDDGSRALGALRSAEMRGFSRIEEAVLVVELPRDSEQRWHPAWIAAHSRLEDANSAAAVDDLFASRQEDAVAPFVFRSGESSVVPPPPARPLWSLPAGLLEDRETVSASELTDRLGCPLRWVFNYQARLRSRSLAELPNDFKLKGLFCHSVLERLFDPLEAKERAQPLGVADARELVGSIFDERLPLDAAPLSLPAKTLERQRLRRELQNATERLVKVLQQGGYRICRIELPVEGTAFGKKLAGRIDCLASTEEGPGGQEAVIDFKYPSTPKYRKYLEDGRAVQLATYAHARSREAGGRYPGVAYLTIADGLLYTPSGSPVAGDNERVVVDGPAIEGVWRQFEAAIDAADLWLNGSEPVPARPLQRPEEWPEGALMVLKEKLGRDEVQEVCRYCDYGVLCGREELQ